MEASLAILVLPRQDRQLGTETLPLLTRPRRVREVLDAVNKDLTPNGTKVDRGKATTMGSAIISRDGRSLVASSTPLRRNASTQS